MASDAAGHSSTIVTGRYIRNDKRIQEEAEHEYVK